MWIGCDGIDFSDKDKDEDTENMCKRGCVEGNRKAERDDEEE